MFLPLAERDALLRALDARGRAGARGVRRPDGVAHARDRIGAGLDEHERREPAEVRRVDERLLAQIGGRRALNNAQMLEAQCQRRRVDCDAQLVLALPAGIL